MEARKLKGNTRIELMSTLILTLILTLIGREKTRNRGHCADIMRVGKNGSDTMQETDQGGGGKTAQRRGAQSGRRGMEASSGLAQRRNKV